MANLYDPRNEDPKAKSFDPNASSQIIQAKTNAFEICLFVFFSIITIGIFAMVMFIKKPNLFKRLENDVNNAASTNATAMTNYARTVSDLRNVVMSEMKWEKDTLTAIIEQRNQAATAVKNFVEAKIDSSNASTIDSFLTKFFALQENYPELKSNQNIGKLMWTIRDLQNEIAASRRLYNSVANEFNRTITTFPSTVVASRMQLETKPLFRAEQSAYEFKVDPIY